MNKILKLDPLVARKIAAGEVVERPASIVKEFIDNAIDAGATTIRLLLERGGIQKVSLEDNGEGIQESDILLALEHHATSKVRTAKDLESIETLGFRGEALSSISAVSRFEIASRTQENEFGFFYSYATETLKPTTMACGTKITASEIFYNLPARRKFLRSERTEFMHIEELFKRYALIHHNIEWTLTHNQKHVYYFPKVLEEADIDQRIRRLCKLKETIPLYKVENEHHTLKLSGWIADDNRPTTECQFFYVNHRIVKDKLIHHAVRLAMEETRFMGGHLAFVVNLTLPPEMVDVNAHPTKLEVRFRDSRTVHAFIAQNFMKAIELLSCKKYNLDKDFESPDKSFKDEHYLSLKEKNIFSSCNIQPSNLNHPEMLKFLWHDYAMFEYESHLHIMDLYDLIKAYLKVTLKKNIKSIPCEHSIILDEKELSILGGVQTLTKYGFFFSEFSVKKWRLTQVPEYDIDIDWKTLFYSLKEHVNDKRVFQDSLYRIILLQLKSNRSVLEKMFVFLKTNSQKEFLKIARTLKHTPNSLKEEKIFI